MSKPTIYMSRAFVEFGPITLEEFHTFKNRGILKETDYFLNDGESTWLHVLEFEKSHPLPTTSQKSEATLAAKPAADRSTNLKASGKTTSSTSAKAASSAKKPSAKKTASKK